MFCDMKGFTALSEANDAAGISSKVMNRYLSTMSEQIRSHRGIIDKLHWRCDHGVLGTPFIEETDQARLACLAAIDMMVGLGHCVRNCLNCSGCVPYQ